MRALVIVDVQNDFLPGGALAVEGGNQIAPVINRLMSCFEVVVASRDWHPADHGSFASQHPGKQIGQVVDLNGLDQVLWPDHCVQGTPGAEFPSELDASRIDSIFKKGTNQEIDSYSSFYDNGHRHDTGMNGYLATRGVTEVCVVGLALDYCVKFTALDAGKCGYATTVALDCTRAVNLEAGDAEAAIEELKQAGVRIVTSSEFIGS